MANTANNNLWVNPEQGGEQLENSGRRNLLLGALAFAVTTSVAGKATDALAQEVQLAALNTETSPLGINYAEIAESPLDAMLRQGEDEFVANASQDARYQKLGVDRAWKSYSSNIAKEKVSPQMLWELEKFTPKLLVSFANLSEQNYPTLYEIWIISSQRQLKGIADKISG